MISEAKIHYNRQLNKFWRANRLKIGKFILR